MKLKELKQKIINLAINGYKVRTNFSSCDFLISLDNLVSLDNFIIIAKPICTENELKYEFMLDTQFISKNEITYEQIVMIKNIIDLLYLNKKLAISRLKKWTVEAFVEDQRQREIRSQEAIEELKEILIQSMKNKAITY